MQVGRRPFRPCFSRAWHRHVGPQQSGRKSALCGSKRLPKRSQTHQKAIGHHTQPQREFTAPTRPSVRFDRLVCLLYVASMCRKAIAACRGASRLDQHGTAAPPLLCRHGPPRLPILVSCSIVTRPACIHPSQHSSSMAEQEEEWHPSEALATDHAARKLWLVKVMLLGRRGLHCWCRTMFEHAVPAASNQHGKTRSAQSAMQRCSPIDCVLILPTCLASPRHPVSLPRLATHLRRCPHWWPSAGRRAATRAWSGARRWAGRWPRCGWCRWAGRVWRHSC